MAERIEGMTEVNGVGRTTEENRLGGTVEESGLSDYLFDAIQMEASDLHITAGLPPMVRIHGRVEPLDYPRMTPNVTRELIYDILSNDQRQRLENEWELDFSYSLPRTARFRVNVYFQKGALGAAFRAIPEVIKSLSELGLPEAVEDMTEKPRGLVLVTGPTGSGKSTSLAAMIDKINDTRHEHIMSVEDPIEFLHNHKKCIVNQREVNQDTKSFAQALKHVLRQDPDVILVGEMRDLETISLAVTAAETGHLVFGTLHTQDAPQTVVPRRDGEGRVVACEVLVPTPGVRNLIREGKNHQIYSAMQTGGKFGMQTMDAALVELVRRGLISREEAERRSSNPDELRRLAGGTLAETGAGSVASV